MNIDLMISALHGRADVHYITGDFAEAVRGYERAIDFCRKESNGDNDRTIGLQIDLVNVLMRTHRDFDRIMVMTDALLKKIDREKNILMHAHIIRIRGSLYWYKGNYDRALTCYQKAKTLYKNTRDAKRMTDMNGNIGLTLQYQGKYDQSLHYYDRYLKALIKKKDLPSIATAYGNIGTVYSFMGNHRKALKYFSRDLDLAKKIGYKYEMGSACSNMGIAYAQKGDFPRALEHFRKSLDIARQMRDLRSIGINENNIGLVHYNMGDLNSAIESFTVKLDISKKLNDNHGLCIAYSNLAIIQQYKGNFKQALRYIDKNLEYAKKINSRVLIGSAYSYQGSIYTDIGRYRNAVSALEIAYKIFTELNATFELSLNNLYTAELCFQENKTERAGTLVGSALSFSGKMGFKKHEIGLLNLKARIHYRHSDPVGAVKYLNESIVLARSHCHLLEMAKSLYELAVIEKAQGDKEHFKLHRDEAHRIFTRAGADVWVRRVENLDD